MTRRELDGLLGSPTCVRGEVYEYVRDDRSDDRGRGAPGRATAADFANITVHMRGGRAVTIRVERSDMT